MSSFTPVDSAVGGLLVGGATAFALLVDGRIAGSSGTLGPFLREAFAGRLGSKLWNLLFIIGMFLGGIVNVLFNKDFAFPGALAITLPEYILGGLLIGIGTRMGKGCTSGHGLCGLARLSPRSLLSVITFMLTAGIVAFVAKYARKGVGVQTFEVAPLNWSASQFTPYCAVIACALTSAWSCLFWKTPSVARKTSALTSGIIFGLGLCCSGMTDQNKVIGFFNVTGQWDPSLAFVMGLGLVMTFPAFFYARKTTSKPLVDDAQWEAPGPGAGSAPIDAQLVLGSVLFGAGWGLCGICPGPAIVSLVPNLIVDITTGLLYSSCFISLCVAWLICDRVCGWCTTKTHIK
mmetsp:Transcript_106377/g.167964  ORF Transcript_106377/g.167964 Transcript_106377/m.167964 type:complete len:347 (+) Transcript_106377:67-1107(+)